MAVSMRCSFSSTTARLNMALTAARRYPTPQRVDGSTQHTSVEVADPLLCPPELDLMTRVSHPVFVSWGGIGAWGVLALRRLASPQSLSCAIQHGSAWIPQDRRLLLIYNCILKRLGGTVCSRCPAGPPSRARPVAHVLRAGCRLRGAVLAPPAPGCRRPLRRMLAPLVPGPDLPIRGRPHWCAACVQPS